MNPDNEKEIRALVEQELPEFVLACKNDKADLILMQQVAFAYEGSPDELMLLGAAIKYAGFHKKEVRIIV